MTVLAQLSDYGQRAVDAARARGPNGILPPGPPEPAVVQTVEWLARPVEYLLRNRARYGETFTMRLAGLDPFVLFSDPAAVKDIFTGPPDVLHAGEANAVLEPILGSSSVLLLDGPRHMRERRLLLPPFHGQRMRAYGEVMRDVTLATIARWPRGRAFAVHPHMQAITLDVILRTVFGVDEGPELRELTDILRVLLARLANPILDAALHAGRFRAALAGRSAAAAARARRRAALSSDSATGERKIGRAGRTSSRCCSTRDTKTARRCAIRSSATS